MMLPRRKFVRVAAGIAAFPVLARAATASDYPTRPVHIVVGLAAGGPNDITARLIADWLSKRLNQSFVVENRPGAASNIATQYVVHSAADGYTLLLVPTPAAINATLYQHLDFNFIRDIAPVAGIVRAPEVMVVNPSLPVRTASDFISYAKANPGKINMASAGNGSVPHVAGEMFKSMAGVNLVTVGYRGGGPALVDLLAGRVQVMFEPTLSTLPYIRSGKLRALAVTSAKRSPALPDLPVLADLVPGYEATSWFGIGAPRNTPTDIIDKLNKQVAMGLDDPEVKQRLVELGGVPMPMSPARFGKLIADETEKWGRVIRAAHIQLE
jgi:tripartite-type tricarboxylate transporter receptor subunit TctC